MGFLKNVIKQSVGQGLSDGISKGISKAFEKAVETSVRPAADKFANKAAENINEAAATLEQGANAQKETRSTFAQAMQNLEQAAEKYNNTVQQYAQNTQTAQTAQNVQTAEPAKKFIRSAAPHTGTAAYFADLITKNIQGVEVRTNVCLSKDAPADKFTSVDVMVFRNGRPAVAIILVPKNSYKTVAVVNTMKACEKNGVRALRFMQEFSNKPEYVVGRIRAAL